MVGDSFGPMLQHYVRTPRGNETTATDDLTEGYHSRRAARLALLIVVVSTLSQNVELDEVPEPEPYVPPPTSYRGRRRQELFASRRLAGAPPGGNLRSLRVRARVGARPRG